MTDKNTVELLANLYPRCFHIYEKRRVPLKLKVHVDILAALEIEPKALAAALRSYCGNHRYLSACHEGAARVDLNGEPCGIVTAEEAACAKERLEQQRARYKRQQQAEVKAKNKDRLSLADLREAAQARRVA